MKKFIVAVYDRKMNYYPQQMIVDDTREASRSFYQHLSTAGNPMSDNPSDFCLVKIGEVIEAEEKDKKTELAINYIGEEILMDGTTCETLGDDNNA